MRDDETPPVPQLYWENVGRRAPGIVPTWPEAQAPRPPKSPVAPTWSRHPAVLGISLVANGVLLASLVSVFLLAHAGAFTPPKSSTQSTPPGSTLGSASATPSVTP